MHPTGSDKYGSDIMNNDKNTIWDNNGGIGDGIKSLGEELVVNICKSNKDDKRLFDIFVSLLNMPQDRILIEISQKMDFNALFDKIKERLELKYDYL